MPIITLVPNDSNNSGPHNHSKYHPNPCKVMTSVTFALLRAFIAAAVYSLAEKADDYWEQECSEHRFTSPFTPGDSCEDIYNQNEQTRDKPGYYWIFDGPALVYCGMNYTGSSCEDVYINNESTRNKSGYYRVINDWMYCNMTAISDAFSRGDVMSSCVGVGGVWKRIAGFNITAGDDCPSPWVERSHNDVNFCTSTSGSKSCSSVSYSTNGMSYQRVCGRASGYQKGTPDAFSSNRDNINSYYVDGLSITHGNGSHQHIWTYAAGLTGSGDLHNNNYRNCPCANFSGRAPPRFVGSHYYCESGAGSSANGSTYYLSDVLWDGAGCSANNTCCDNPNLPWFYRELNMATDDDIEVRICTSAGFNDEAILITNLELYVQ